MTITEQTPSLYRSFLVPAESLELRLSLHAIIGSDLAQAPALVVEVLTSLFQPIWKEQLAARNVSAEAFKAVLLQCYREVFLWVNRDRMWTQTVEGIIGRIDRRYPLV